MRWPRKRRRSTVGDAEAAARDALIARGAAEHALHQAESQDEKVTRLGGRIADELTRNHFADALRASMRGKRAG